MCLDRPPRVDFRHFDWRVSEWKWIDTIQMDMGKSFWEKCYLKNQINVESEVFALETQDIIGVSRGSMCFRIEKI